MKVETNMGNIHIKPNKNNNSPPPKNLKNRKAKKSSGRRIKKQKILILDNNPRDISKLAGFLRDEPYDIFATDTGQECLEILRNEKIDLAVIEIHIEDMDGATLLKQVKAENIHTTMIAVTERGTMELAQKVLKAGAVRVFDKPIARDVFLAKIKKYMSPRASWKNKVEAFFEANYNNPNLQFPAFRQYVGYSTAHSCVLLKKHFGKTFSEKLREVRIEKAKCLLEETELPAFKIAKLCGFHSSKRLGETFKRLCGIPPLAYRKKWRIVE